MPNEVTKTAISKLKEYHDSRRTHNTGPQYHVEVHTNALPPAFKAICSYQSHRTEGFGRSKTDAKQNAADEMLLLLTGTRTSASFTTAPTRDVKLSTNSSKKKVLHSNISLTDTQKRYIASFMANYQETSELKINIRNNSENKEDFLKDVNLGLKNEDAPKSLTLQTCKKNYSDPVQYFVKVMDEMKLKFCCDLPPVKAGITEHVAYIKIDYNLLMAGGIGASKEEAIFNACKNAVELLAQLIE